MTPAADQTPDRPSELLREDQVAELLRDIHDRLRTIEAVDDAILGELRHQSNILGRGAPRRVHQV